ncbi:UDP-MurNac-pentapeptide presynthetase MurF [Helicobacter sp. 13S00401-1]|uniref:Mur ligase family protein n=1 Tax=Helicobacter sp. 13S00401-1 TaxID=1905758 RepID=UPI000BA7631D|nr:UDP-N-acetylmuramoyl-tripeptide--D-alanyl-D-alanine ligase [Helicobacter sp. 13S00401-1]PAF51881.1 UDP-MurNac-pentapeptide presynthetase MurF [Helicobacter sp. 13S00401-1]
MSVYFTLNIISHFIMIFLLTYYLTTLLQWYNYSFYRILTKHHKKLWHFYYFVLPIIVFLVTDILRLYIVFYVCLIIWIIAFGIWLYRLDKKLVFTKRVIRLFVIVLLFTILNEAINIIDHLDKDKAYISALLYLAPLVFGFIVAFLYESLIFRNYAKLAKAKLAKMPNLTIVAITGSYGKTSTKNFLEDILKERYDVYATPRSVNTYKGLVNDINSNLDPDTEVYIAEAGARAKNDIRQIANLLNPQYAIIGKVGLAHIEYFKSLENTLSAKFELLDSKKLQKAFVQRDNKTPEIKESYKENINLITTYPPEHKNITTSLDFTSFELKINGVYEEFQTKVLGSFNVDNIAACILVALELKVPLDTIKKAVSKLESIPHRLNKIVTNNKLILDDSFNGNLEGVSEAIRLSSLYNGRKVIVTPGLVESNTESNIKIAKLIDEVFDLAIITGELNSKILNDNIQHTQKVVLKDKSNLEGILKSFGQDGDLVLFANDAPSYI